MIVLELREDWTVDGKTYKSGSLLTAPLKPWLKGKKKIQVLFEPTKSTSLSYFTTTKDYLILTLLEDVKSKIQILEKDKKQWNEVAVSGIPEFGRLRITPVDSDDSNEYWLTVEFYYADSLYLGILMMIHYKTKILVASFDASELGISAFCEQRWNIHSLFSSIQQNCSWMAAIQPFSMDMVVWGSCPIIVHPLVLDGRKGGVYVVANIRGGEYGPQWHQAALKTDIGLTKILCLLENLVSRNILHLKKIQGGSNGLLMGNVYTLSPEHWGGCVSGSFGLKRYTKLLAGASWVGEYGDPDIPEQWEYIQTFSPYHNIDGGVYHVVTASTGDDRVHPAHLRKMTQFWKRLIKMSLL